MKRWIEKIKDFFRNQWLTLALAALCCFIFCSLIYQWTEPEIPHDRQLRVQMAGGIADFVPLRDEMGPQWSQTLGLQRVTVEYDIIDVYNPVDKSWEFFNMDVMLASADVMLIPRSKAEYLASMGVLSSLDGYLADGSLTGETYSFENDQYETHAYALKAENLTGLGETYLMDLSGQDEAQLVYCIPAYSKNVPAALAWIALDK